MDVLERIEQVIGEPLRAHGYTIVCVRHIGKTFQIMIEREDEVPINLEDCTRVHHMVSSLLDVYDVIKGHYILEISSAGIERPLVHLKDYERFKGRMIVVHTHDLWDGRKKQKATIQESRDDLVCLLKEGAEEGEWFSLDRIKNAHLFVKY